MVMEGAFLPLEDATVSGAWVFDGTVEINGTTQLDGAVTINGTLLASGVNTFGGAATFQAAVTMEAALALESSILSNSPSAGIGYSTGAGGTVTQGTDDSTTVILNTITGELVLFTSTLAAGADTTFTLTNSAIGADDAVIVGVKTYGGTADGIPAAQVEAVAAGSCLINVQNIGGVTLDAVPTLFFAVIKGVVA